MADSGRSNQLHRVAFVCPVCDYAFKREPGRVAEDPSDEVHPWRYFASCSKCGMECEQAWWERNLLKAWANSSGPKTEAGKLAVTANLEGHPTPEETRRTRFNAMKHGAYANTATYFPARPGKYPECEGCEYLEEVCPQQVACLKKMELFMQVHVAMESGDPDALNAIHANVQSSFFGVLQDMFRQVIADGPRLCHQAYYYDKDGGLHWVERYNPKTGDLEPVMDYDAHPLLKIIGEWMSKNNISLDDLAMTRKGQEDRSIDMGFIEAEKQSKEQMAGYQERQAKALEDLRDMAERGRQKLREDPVYLEHQENG